MTPYQSTTPNLIGTHWRLSKQSPHLVRRGMEGEGKAVDQPRFDLEDFIYVWVVHNRPPCKILPAARINSSRTLYWFRY